MDALPLSAPQATFEHEDDLRLSTFSNCSLLHKLLITGQGEQVVRRRGELNRDLLSSTCEYTPGKPISKVSCRVGLKCSLEIKILCTNSNKIQRISDV